MKIIGKQNREHHALQNTSRRSVCFGRFPANQSIPLQLGNPFSFPKLCFIHRSSRRSEQSCVIFVVPTEAEESFLTIVRDVPTKLDMTGLISTRKTDIKSMHLDELRGIAQPSYRAGQITNWLYQKRISSFAEMTDLPQVLRQQLTDNFAFGKIDVLRVLGSKDTTRKFLFRLSDNNLIESVLIPASPALYGSPSDRRTICLSTQVGCAYGCKFCASGLDGWKQNLRADEIVNQIMAVEAATGERIDNIVFMGMGEPLGNYDNVMRAIQIINAPWGIGIGARHITISTSGLVPQIRQLADQPLQIRLAVSLHGANDEVRSQIMPVNRKYNLSALLEACRYFTSRKKQRITFEYILIDQVNDSEEQARQLAKHARGLEAKVNLIPYNTVEGLDWRQPSPKRQKEFLAILCAAGVRATLRREKGDDIAAACGQLRLQTERHLAAPVIESTG
jgi:23S rRNA (adenine2503-C2)-methyltransferase